MKSNKLVNVKQEKNQHSPPLLAGQAVVLRINHRHPQVPRGLSPGLSSDDPLYDYPAFTRASKIPIRPVPRHAGLHKNSIRFTISSVVSISA